MYYTYQKGLLAGGYEKNLPIKVWAKEGEIEQGALDQISNVAFLPFAFHHIALMPDAHQGYGMPIGGVAALDNVISPNMVGVDIGCGMHAVKTDIKEARPEDLKKWMSEIRKVVPVGKGAKHDRPFKLEMPEYSCGSDKVEVSGSPVIESEHNNAMRQIGTLGAGNHFIEIQRDEDGFIWVMIHTGSRHLGFQVGKVYNQKAKDLNKKWHSEVNEKADLAFLSLDFEAGQSYIKAMKYCLLYAWCSRRKILRSVQLAMDFGYEDSPYLDVHHNYAALENHFGKNLWVHRKGAIRTREGELGVIPGSQGTASYIVKGLGNPESFMSASHGAGRVLSRTKARATLNISDVVKNLDQKGIIHSIRDKADLDEAPEAYKNIDEVMANQVDLVEIVTKLEPLAVIKG